MVISPCNFLSFLYQTCIFISSGNKMAVAEKDSFRPLSDFNNPVYTSKESLCLILGEHESSW